MPTGQQYHRIDTRELKSQIERKVGREKAEQYFDLLPKFFSLKISKSDFDKLCIATIGRENICIHNSLVRAIIKNASLSRTPPPRRDCIADTLITKKYTNGCHSNSFHSLCKDLPQSPRKGRTPNLRERKFKDRPSPLGPNGKSNVTVLAKPQEQNIATELLSLTSRPQCSDEDGEEVEQSTRSPGLLGHSPIKAPLGISLNRGTVCQGSYNKMVPGFLMDTCYSSEELPDTSCLKRRLEQRLAAEGLKVSTQCADLLNNALDVFVKRLIKPSLELSRARGRQVRMDPKLRPLVPGFNGVRFLMEPRQCTCVSQSDFQAAMELNPQILGVDWPVLLEKIQLRESEE